jgi:amidase
MSDLHRLSAVEQLALLGSQEISSVELTEHYLARISEHDADLGAFLTVDPEAALAEAARADERRAVPGSAVPPLLGLPVPIKDLSPTAGLRTTFGSAAFADYVPPADSWTVGLIRGAGAVLLGKTNVPEFGPTCYTENDLVGPALSPFGTGRYASGSSGGAAAAVAAGLAPVAHGSDGAGSVRTPAGACGLVGFKPSRGTVSQFPQVAFAALGIEGPIARDLADAALLADVMAVPPAGELWPDPRPAGAPSLSAALRGAPPRPLRIGWWTDPGVDGVQAHPAVVDAVASAAQTLADLGHIVSEIPCPAPIDEPVIDALVMRFAAGIANAGLMVPPDRLARLRPLSHWFLDRARTLSAADAAAAEAVMAAYGARSLVALAEYDVVLCPTTSGPPVTVGWFSKAGFDEEPRRMIGWSSGTAFANVTGYGAVSLPLAWTEDLLPIGVQLAMAPGRDHELFAVAALLMTAASPRPLPPMF